MNKPVVTIYTRPGCHLCDEAKTVILKSNCAREFKLEEIDIDHDAALRAQYTNDVPVIFIGAIKAFKHRVDQREFERKFRRLSRG